MHTCPHQSWGDVVWEVGVCSHKAFLQSSAYGSQLGVETMVQFLMAARGRGHCDQWPHVPSTIWWTAAFKLWDNINITSTKQGLIQSHFTTDSRHHVMGCILKHMTLHDRLSIPSFFLFHSFLFVPFSENGGQPQIPALFFPRLFCSAPGDS